MLPVSFKDALIFLLSVCCLHAERQQSMLTCCVCLHACHARRMLQRSISGSRGARVDGRDPVTERVLDCVATTFQNRFLAWDSLKVQALAAFWRAHPPAPVAPRWQRCGAGEGGEERKSG